MGLLDFLRRKGPSDAAGASARPQAAGDSFIALSLDDPYLAEFLRGGSATHSGAVVNPFRAMHNTAVFRCVDLISSSIGMLPLYLKRLGPNGSLTDAVDHDLYDLLLTTPNHWQTAFEFRSQMQMNALVEGDGFALIIRSRGKIIRLIPLHPSRVKPEQADDWTVTYRVQRKDGSIAVLPSSDVFHLHGLSRDGVCGLSRTNVAREAIGLAMRSEEGAARLYKNGMLVGGALSHPTKLSPEAYNRLQASIIERYSGAENAHKWVILEEGMTPHSMTQSAVDAQLNETRNHQIEEIARAFGVPRPLLMMDDTSWGSGIEQLGILFVRFGLSSWFSAWEQAIIRSLLTVAERRTLRPDFDEKELLRGSMKDQGDFYAKALGAGGQRPWMTQNEVRDDVGLGPRDDGDSLVNPMTQPTQPAGGGDGGAPNAP